MHFDKLMVSTYICRTVSRAIFSSFISRPRTCRTPTCLDNGTKIERSEFATFSQSNPSNKLLWLRFVIKWLFKLNLKLLRFVCLILKLQCLTKSFLLITLITRLSFRKSVRKTGINAVGNLQLKAKSGRRVSNFSQNDNRIYIRKFWHIMFSGSKVTQ